MGALKLSYQLGDEPYECLINPRFSITDMGFAENILVVMVTPLNLQPTINKITEPQPVYTVQSMFGKPE